MLTFLRWALGWGPVIVPSGSCVAVYGHTSYWEAFLLLLYLPEAHIVTLLKPQLFTWYLGPVLRRLGYIPAPKLEDKGTGGVQAIVRELKQLGGPIIFLISPKGSIAKRPWRSGYKHIAEALGWPVRALLVDYSERTLTFKDSNNDEASLQAVLGTACPRNPERSEFEVTCCYDDYELLGVVDLVAVSNAFSLPAILKAYWIGHWAMGTLGATAFIFSWLYHLSRETQYRAIDAFFAKLLIVTSILRYFQNITWTFVGLFIITLWCYYAGTPREAPKKRHRYVVYHSLFHVFLGIAAYTLIKV